jgi:hypothetical protein
VDAPQAREGAQTRAAPWMLFRSSATDRRGLLGQTTYVQLLNTSGGAPPAGAVEPGGRVQVPYTGRYAFYLANRNGPTSGKPTP